MRLILSRFILNLVLIVWSCLGEIEEELLIDESQNPHNHYIVSSKTTARVFATVLLRHTADNNEQVQIVTMDVDQPGDDSAGEEPNVQPASTTEEAEVEKEKESSPSSSAIASSAGSNASKETESANEFIFTTRLSMRAKPMPSKMSAAEVTTGLSIEFFIMLFLTTLCIFAL